MRGDFSNGLARIFTDRGEGPLTGQEDYSIANRTPCLNEFAGTIHARENAAERSSGERNSDLEEQKSPICNGTIPTAKRNQTCDAGFWACTGPLRIESVFISST